MASFSETSELKKLHERIVRLGELKVEIGWFESAQHPVTGKGGAVTGTIPTASIAAQNEFGNPKANIPPRPFMRPTLASNRGLWRDQIKQGSRAVILGTETENSMMEKIGLSVSGHIRAAIAQVQKPALEKETVQARLRIRKDKKTIGLLEKPLVFEGILLNSLTYIIKDGEEIQPYIGKGGG